MTVMAPEGTGGTLTPHQWVGLLHGVDLAPVPIERGSPVQVAMFRFPWLPQRVVLPPMDAHYISFTLAGRLIIEREMDGPLERCAFRPGMSLIIPAGREYAWRWNRGTDELHLYISRSWLAETADAAGLGGPLLLPRFGFEDRVLHALASALLDERRSGGLGGSLYSASVADTMALRLLRDHCSAERMPQPVTLAPARLRRVRELVDERLGSPLTVEDMADAAGLSRAHFTRCFHAATGCTPYGYVRERRVARARELLQGSAHSIAEVAAVTGFHSQSHLGRVFRGATGMTPGEYRRRMAG
ncbi:MAG TPA: AraC family transcriptional regulator [Gaiellales bacterium]|nr:AraC family transcriptional regulator [Gaiellales bacterium]